MSATANPALSTVGIPKEIKGDERRVALTPDGAAELVGVGCEVRVEHGAGIGAGFTDEMYEAAGASIVPTPNEAWEADLVVKV
ncbi:MAG: alanine dehydrogenase, partial [Actinomycetota bacterium]|nr:alanine dehydrogenase [Actinomycetota bacterium]